MPEEGWPDDWWRDAAKTKPKYWKPVVILEKALYGHPDAGGTGNNIATHTLRK